MMDYKEFNKAVELYKKSLREPLTKEIKEMSETKNEIELKVLKDADIINRVEKREPLVICGVKYVPEGVNVMTDIKNQPHYTQFKIQPVVFIAENNIPYLEGNVIKYVCRYNMKNGIEDLKKAQHYLEMLISKLEGNGVFGSGEVKQEEKVTLSNNYIIKTNKCMFCNGEGTRVVGDPLSDEKETCKVCNGSGIILHKQKDLERINSENSKNKMDLLKEVYRDLEIKKNKQSEGE